MKKGLREIKKLSYQRFSGVFGIGFMAVWILYGVLYGALSFPQAPPLPEYQVKAALIYKFTKFINWPAAAFRGSEQPFTFCVLGQDPFGEALDELVGKPAAGRIMTIQRATRVESLKGECQIIFISPSEYKNLSTILNQLQGTPVLLISDIERFAELGGMIGLLTIGGRIRFTINLTVMRQAGLEVSAQLLELAIVVRSDKNPPDQ